MLSQEHPKLPSIPTDSPVQFWTRQKAEGPAGKEYWLNVATRTPQTETPVLGRGGIIADGMGLGTSPFTGIRASKTDDQGKTLTVLALVLASLKEKEGAGISNATLIGISYPLMGCKGADSSLPLIGTE